MGTRTLWTVFRVLVWSTLVLWVHPQWLEPLGARSLAAFLEHHHWIRLMGVPPLGILAILSVLDPLDSPAVRQRAQALATELDAAVTALPPMHPEYGSPYGPGLRVPVGEQLMTIERWRKSGQPTTVARLELDGWTDLTFIVHDAGSEPALLQGLQREAVAVALEDVARRASDPKVKANARAMAFLGNPPVTLGIDSLDTKVVVHANDADRVRDLLTSPDVAEALEAVANHRFAWKWSLQPAGGGGHSEMRFECRSSLDDAASIRLVEELVRAALEDRPDEYRAAA